MVLTVHDAAFHSIVYGLRQFTLSSYTTGLGILERTIVTLLLYFVWSND